MDNKNSDRPERRTALIGKELQRYNVDIAAISETRLPDEGQRTELGSGYTFFWKGKPLEQRRLHGVGFAIKTKLVSQLNIHPTGISERIMSLRLPLEGRNFVTILSVYAPTLDSEDETKESFYHNLRQTLQSVPVDDKLFILGDFNARVGKNHQLWKDVIGKEGVGNVNSNGYLLLGLCTEMGLLITNTIFRLKNKHKTSWMHPRSRHWHLIDYVITRNRDRTDVNVTKAVRGADDCWTDHRLIVSRVTLHLKPRPRPTQHQPTRKKLNLQLLKDQNNVRTLLQRLEEELDKNPPSLSCANVEEHWNSFKESVTVASRDALGFRALKHQDWFDDNDAEITDLINKKRQAKKQMDNHPSSQAKRQIFRDIKASVQTKLRQIQNQWWIDKANEIQTFADRRDMRNFYQSLKAVYGPRGNVNAPIKTSDEQTLLKDEQNILQRWTEHFHQLLNRASNVNHTIIQRIKQRPHHLDLDVPPSLVEVTCAINCLKNNKSPGNDGIPAEVFKTANSLLAPHLHNIFLNIWEKAEVPSDFKDALIVTIFKKGDKSVCGNYRGISLLSTAGKVLAVILLKRLVPIAEEILPETQHGFRPGRGTIDMIFVARQLLEKSKEHRVPLHLIFFDLEKAFDSICRETLWRILAKFGLPSRFISIVRALHDGMTGQVLYRGTTSPEFSIQTGVKQGCVLAPTLFSLYLAALHQTLPETATSDVNISTRPEGNVFNLGRLRAKTRCQTIPVNELQYADDNAAPSHDINQLQEMTDSWDLTYEAFGLKVNKKKTQTLHYLPRATAAPRPISINGTNLKQVTSFPYLGSILSSDGTIDEEILNRLRLAHAAYGRLTKRVFTNSNLRASTKLAVYRAVVISTLLYACETWTMYRRHLKALEQFHQQKLRQILNISWEERKTNVEVLEQANMTSIEASIVRHQLRWTGHVTRMNPSRLPKQVFFGQLPTGSRHQGRPIKRYKDYLKANLRSCALDPTQLEELAASRSDWRATSARASETFEANRREKEKARRRRRKMRLALIHERVPIIQCPRCPRKFHSHLGLHSHLRAHDRRGHV